MRERPPVPTIARDGRPPRPWLSMQHDQMFHSYAIDVWRLAYDRGYTITAVISGDLIDVSLTRGDARFVARFRRHPTARRVRWRFVSARGTDGAEMRRRYTTLAWLGLDVEAMASLVDAQSQQPRQPTGGIRCQRK